jgi:hypothetical protein
MGASLLTNTHLVSRVTFSPTLLALHTDYKPEAPQIFEKILSYTFLLLILSLQHNTQLSLLPLCITPACWHSFFTVSLCIKSSHIIPCCEQWFCCLLTVLLPRMSTSLSSWIIAISSSVGSRSHFCWWTLPLLRIHNFISISSTFSNPWGPKCIIWL